MCFLYHSNMVCFQGLKQRGEGKQGHLSKLDESAWSQHLAEQAAAAAPAAPGPAARPEPSAAELCAPGTADDARPCPGLLLPCQALRSRGTPAALREGAAFSGAGPGNVALQRAAARCACPQDRLFL